MVTEIVGGIETVEKNKLLLYCDNKAAINIAYNLVQHGRTKHIEIDRHFIKENLINGNLRLDHLISDEQLVVVFTKGLNNKTYRTLVYKLGMCDINTPT